MSDWDHPEIRALIALALREDIGSGRHHQRSHDSGRPDGARPFLRASGSAMLAGVELLPIIYEMHGGVDELILFSKSGDKVEADHAVAKVRGSCAHAAGMRASVSQLHPAAFRRRDSRAQVCRCGRGDQMPGSRHTEDDSGIPAPGEAGGSRGRRDKPPDRTVRRRAHQEQSHHRRRRRPACAWSVSVRRSFPLTLQSKSRSERGKNSTKRLSAGAWHVLLDNLTPKQAAAEIDYIAGRAKVELSGNITLDTIRAYAQTGADFVSCGAITHQAQAVNFNFRIDLL